MGHACFGYWVCVSGYRCFFSTWIIFHWHHHHHTMCSNAYTHKHSSIIFINGHLLRLIFERERERKEKWFRLNFLETIYLSAIKLRSVFSHTTNMIDECILKFINCKNKNKKKKWINKRERKIEKLTQTTGAACRIQSNSFNVQSNVFDIVVSWWNVCVCVCGKCKMLILCEDTQRTHARKQIKWNE